MVLRSFSIQYYLSDLILIEVNVFVGFLLRKFILVIIQNTSQNFSTLCLCCCCSVERVYKYIIEVHLFLESYWKIIP